MAFLEGLRSTRRQLTDVVDQNEREILKDIRSFNTALGDQLGTTGEKLQARLQEIERDVSLALTVREEVEERVTGKVAELTAKYEKQIQELADSRKSLESRLTSLEARDDTPTAWRESSAIVDSRAMQSLPSWSGPTQQEFIEWAWGFGVALENVRRGLGRVLE